MKENKKARIRAMGIGVTVATTLTLCLAAALSAAHLPLAVILPTAAPVWVGITTMLLWLQG